MNKERWIQTALEKGWDSFEIYQSEQKGRSLSWFDGQMDSFVTHQVLGTSLRGVIDGHAANLATEDIRDEEMDAVLEQMRQQAEMINTGDVAHLRHPEDGPVVVRKKQWIQPDPAQVQALMKQVEEACKTYDPRIVQVAGLEWEESARVRTIRNSNGIDIQDEDRLQYFFASVAAQEEDVVKDAYHIEVVEDIRTFDVNGFVETLCEKALFQLHATSLKSQQTPVIFEREAMTSLFAVFLSLFDGEQIYKQISPLKNKLDTQIFSEKVTIIDDPRNTEALQIINYDDEGCPTRRKELVSKGVFTQMLHNTKSAARMHAFSTGNGFKGGYASPVTISPMNCWIVPGKCSLEQMQENMKDGLVITSLAGLHAGIDFVTTDFSLQAKGYWVKDGKKDHAVHLITVAGNFMELMNQIEEIGSDLKWEYHSVVSPSIRFTSCSVSGE